MQMYRDTSDHGLCLSEYIYIYVCMYLFVYLCMYFIYIYIYIHIHIQRNIRDNWRSLEMSRDIDRCQICSQKEHNLDK